MMDERDRETLPEQPTQQRQSYRRVRWSRPGDWPIRIKILLGVVAVVILALSITAYINARSLQARLRERIGAEFGTLASSEIGAVAEILSKQLIVLQTIAMNDLVKEYAQTVNAGYSGDPTAIEAQLLGMDEQWRAASDDSQLVQSIVSPASNPLAAQLFDYALAFPDHVEIFLTDRYGGLLASTDRTSDYYQADEAWWQAAYQDGQGAFYVSQPEYDESAGYTSIVMAAPIVSRSGGAVIGIARTTFRMDAIYQALSALQFADTGQSTIIDSSGLVIASSDRDRVGSQVSASWYTPQIMQAPVGSVELMDEKGVPTVAGYAAISAIAGTEGGRDKAVAIQSLGWTLFATQAQAEAYAPVVNATRTGLLAAGVFAIIAAVLAFAIAHTLVAPITELVGIARRMTAGDLSARARVRRRDETGELAGAFNRMADEIAGMVGSLQQRIAERTRDLERRTRFLQATAEVAQDSASELDMQELLSRIATLVSDRFGFYHVGVFLLDGLGEYATLRAANSEGGQRMLARGHRLKVGQMSMVGYATGRGEPRVALDVGADAIHFDNPDLPETRSEIALPLRARGQILGALDVQSREPGAFGQEDIEVLQTLADQVALAISNAQLFQQLQERMESERRAYGESSRQAWGSLVRARPNLGYRYEQGGVIPVNGSSHALPARASVGLEPAGEAESNREAQRSDAGEDLPELALPIRVRGHVVGTINSHKRGERGAWTAEEIALMETMVENLSQALESARLYQDTQRRATRERTIQEISDRMQRSADMATLMQIAVEELNRRLGGSRAYVRLGTEAQLLGGASRWAGEGEDPSEGKPHE